MKTMQNKNRYSIPSKIIEYLYIDNSFFNEVVKIKKSINSNSFPKTDEWRDEEGFHLSLALAGYSPDDVEIISERNYLTIKGSGMDSISPQKSPASLEDTEDEREVRTRMNVGVITRGIARRKFVVSYLISEEFDVSSAEAIMEHGLLHIKIPNSTFESKKIVIRRNNERD